MGVYSSKISLSFLDSEGAKLLLEKKFSPISPKIGKISTPRAFTRIYTDDLVRRLFQLSSLAK